MNELGTNPQGCSWQLQGCDTRVFLRRDQDRGRDGSIGVRPLLQFRVGGRGWSHRALGRTHPGGFSMQVASG
jgi:hypothetical protein